MSKEQFNNLIQPQRKRRAFGAPRVSIITNIRCQGMCGVKTALQAARHKEPGREIDGGKA